MENNFFDDNYLENLKKELKYCIVEHEMLLNTYNETLEKGFFENSNDILDQCLSKEGDIGKLKREIAQYEHDRKIACEQQIPKYTSTQTEYVHYDDSNPQTDLSTRITNGKFSVKMPQVPEDMVERVDFNDEELELALTLYDIVRNGVPLSKVMLDKMHDEDVFDLSIEYFDKNGQVLCKEEYRECLIERVDRTNLECGNDGFLEVYVTISYKDMAIVR